MSHVHSHTPAADTFGRAFALGIGLNLTFVVVEAWYGWQSNSLSLLADAGHNLSDVAGLLLAWAALGAARLKPNSRHSYGWRKGSIIASFVNAVVLLVAMGALAWEASSRFASPKSVDATTVIVVAAVGMVINAVTAWLFRRGSKRDLNIRGAYLHMAADALVSAGVVLAGLLYLWQGWSWVDPVVSLLIALVIIASTWSLFRQSLHLLFDGVPGAICLPEVEDALRNLSGVLDVHDLHVWAMSTTENALTAHLVIDAVPSRDRLLDKAIRLLGERFDLQHVTLQLESRDFSACHLSEGCGGEQLSGLDVYG